MSDKKSDRIPADKLTAYERWELPTMQPGGNDVIRSQVSSAEIAVKPLTASDLEKIRLEAYEAGFSEGQKEGVAQGHKEGLEKGFQEGLDSGTQQGLQKGQQTGQQQKQAEIDENIARLSSVMAQLIDPIKQHDDEIEEALLNLVLAISRAVIIRELSLDSQQVRNTVTDALSSLPPTSSNVKIWVNSVDYDTVFSVIESIGGDAQVIKSDEILPGGCKVETLHSQIDATVEKRFQKTVQQMLDRHASSLPADEAPDLADSMDDMTDFHREVLESTDQSVDAPAGHNFFDPKDDDADTNPLEKTQTDHLDVALEPDVEPTRSDADGSLPIDSSLEAGLLSEADRSATVDSPSESESVSESESAEKITDPSTEFDSIATSETPSAVEPAINSEPSENSDEPS